MCELAAGVYNLMKGTPQHALPVGDFMDCVSTSDEGVEANLSTMFQSVCGSKQYWYLRLCAWSKSMVLQHSSLL